VAWPEAQRPVSARMHRGTLVGLLAGACGRTTRGENEADIPVSGRDFGSADSACCCRSARLPGRVRVRRGVRVGPGLTGGDRDHDGPEPRSSADHDEVAAAATTSTSAAGTCAAPTADAQLCAAPSATATHTAAAGEVAAAAARKSSSPAGEAAPRAAEEAQEGRAGSDDHAEASKRCAPARESSANGAPVVGRELQLLVVRPAGLPRGGARSLAAGRRARPQPVMGPAALDGRSDLPPWQRSDLRRARGRPLHQHRDRPRRLVTNRRVHRNSALTWLADAADGV
jgi:hypothetical protein